MTVVGDKKIVSKALISCRTRRFARRFPARNVKVTATRFVNILYFVIHREEGSELCQHSPGNMPRRSCCSVQDSPNSDSPLQNSQGMFTV